jgi:hypothetical protein
MPVNLLEEFLAESSLPAVFLRFNYFQTLVCKFSDIILTMFSSKYMALILGLLFY